ncbi:hypothetical protein Agub_g2360, partial [Astrephomene gubernaculifera]
SSPPPPSPPPPSRLPPPSPPPPTRPPLLPPKFSPPPPPITYWATSASTAKDPLGFSTTGGAVAKLLGAPNANVLKAIAKGVCKPGDAANRWIPSLETPRTAVLYFNQTPAAKVSRVGAVVAYVLNRGTIDPAIASIELLLQTPSQQATNATQQQWVNIYRGSSSDQQLTCPGLNRFPVSAAALQPPVSAAVFAAAEVVGVRLNVGAGATSNKANLPQMAAMGLQMA